jgi:large conductance mechanosensitive channel
MSIVSEFKAFIQRGNVVDMAIGVIMGGAFGKIVNSLVADVLTPPLGYITGGVDFKELKQSLPPVTIQVPDPTTPGSLIAKALPAAEIKYGLFVQSAFDFLIIAFCVFLLVKLMNKMKKKEEEQPAAPPPPTTQEKLLTEIRDLLKSHA